MIKKFNTLLTLFLLSGILLPTLSVADVKKGHRIYKKKMQKHCKFAGSIFARKHTQDAWEKIYNEKRFKQETKKICPQFDIEKLNDKQWKDLYDFTYQYGLGGEIPNGCDPV